MIPAWRVFSIEMFLPLLPVLAGFAPGQFSEALVIAQPVRLELSPVIDGAMEKEEWDPFGTDTYLQWEPGKVHVAAQLPPGKDLVLSIDGKGDGWLVGRDNLEFRVSVKDGKAQVTARELDATAVKEPVWRERPELQFASVAMAGANGFVEATLDDAGMKVFPRSAKTMKVRLDIADSADSPAYLPRTCSVVRFDDHRDAALPREMQSGIQARTRAVVPGESVNLRLTFNGSNKLGAKGIDMRTLGKAEDAANRMALIFPTFDAKGRAFVDYSTKIDPTATVGYRVVRGTVSFNEGPAGVVEASYFIAPKMDFTLLKCDFARLPENNVLRIPYVLQMYTQAPAEGLVYVEAPSGWRVVSGDKTKFAVFGGQSLDARQLELRVPADSHGTFPVTISGETKGGRVSRTCYVTIR